MLPEIYFYHIPKTAGTSLAAMIRNAYPKNQCMQASLLVDLLQYPKYERSKFKCYTGHFYSVLTPLIEREIPTVTLLRNPFDQVFSTLQYNKKIYPGDKPSIIFYKMILNGLLSTWKYMPSKIKEIMEIRLLSIVMNNFQTRCLGCDINVPDSLKKNAKGISYPVLEASFYSQDQDMPFIFERAKERLKKMVVVGTVERFSESLKLIFNYIGTSSPVEIRRDNVSIKRKDNHQFNYRSSTLVSTEIAELIDSHINYDIQLYQFANDLLDMKIQESKIIF